MDKSVATLKNGNIMIGFVPGDAADANGFSVGKGVVLSVVDSRGTLLQSKIWQGNEGWYKESAGTGAYSAGGARNNAPGESYVAMLIKMSGNGNFLWKKHYTIPSFDNLDESAAGDLYMLSNLKDDGFYVTRLQPDGTPVWSRLFRYVQIPDMTNITTMNIQVLGSSVYVFGLCTGYEFVPQMKLPHSILAMKIDTATGLLRQAKSFFIPGNTVLVTLLKSAAVNGQLALWGGSKSDSSKVIFHIKLDSALNDLGAFQFTGNKLIQNLTLQMYLDITPAGLTLASRLPDDEHPLSELNTKRALFLKINNEMKIQFQRKIDFPDNPAHLFFLTNRMGDNFLISEHNSIVPSYFRVSKIPDISSGRSVDCFGKDTTVFSPAESIFFTESQLEVAQSQPLDINYRNEIAYEAEYPVDEEMLCEQVDACDSISVSGDSTICDVTDITLFEAKTNIDCLKKVMWDVSPGLDATATLAADKTLAVRFNGTGQSGFIRAYIPGCNISDSIEVRVADPVKQLSLGRDTVLCSDPITLYATEGYVAYLWQDDSKLDTFVVKKQGRYWVTAIDACGVEYSDTISVSGDDLVFSAGMNQTVCLYDSVSLKATPGYYNYRWTHDSQTTESKSPNITVFPEATTRYVVTAEKSPGCVVKDSVEIAVEKCPRKIIFPNAFSPNADGLNDEFKPYVEGNLSYYDLKIYNRYGQQIYQSSNPGSGWDGYYRSVLQPVGVYVFICGYRFPGQPTEMLNGNVNLIR